MLIDPDGNPNRSIYLIGARILDYMNSSRFQTFDIHRTFREINDNSSDENQRFSFEHFLLALDWLYLINKVSTDGKGDFRRCS